MNWKMPDIYNNDTFIHTPNIDRIGEEGAELKYYSTNSLCVPGRTALLTGKYGHESGTLNNANYPSQTIPTIPKILHANGYYTAMCGKWMLGNPFPKPEFNYWLWAPNASTYYNDTARYFYDTISVTEHMTDFITDSALQLISRIDTPFFMYVSYNAPHAPYVPQVQFDTLYNSNTFETLPNWNPYIENYPSFLYCQGSNPFSTIPEYNHEKRDYYEMIHGVEIGTGKILDSLQANGLLENTMVIFTSDNGFLLGEHRLRGKSLPYDECMRLPLFIRYPNWFQPGTLVDSSISLNIDIAPTILDAVGIPDTFNMDGTSIHSIFTNQFKRKEFLYEQTPEAGDSSSAVRTFRDNYFQYNRYYCTDTTEELFDMLTDPYQKKNLVHHYLYQDTLNLYRLKLDSIRVALNDTGAINSTYCYLLNPAFTFEPPVLSVTHVNATCGFANGSIDVTVSGGTAPFYFSWNTADTTEDLNNISAGTYHVTVTDAHGSTAALNIYVGNSNGPTLTETHINCTFSNANGSINLQVTGTAPPYTYSWSNGATTQGLQNILPGNYTVTVTDHNGCISFLTVSIHSVYTDPNNTDGNSSLPDSAGVQQTTAVFAVNDFGDEIMLYPNPAADEIYVTVKNKAGACAVELYNGFGIKLKTAEIKAGVTKPLRINLNQFPSGNYFVRVVNGEQSFIKSFSVVK